MEEASGNAPLSMLAFFLLKWSGLITHFRLKEAQLVAFLQRIEAGYPNNPYHNRMHAAGVLQLMHLIIHKGGLRRLKVVNKVTTLTCIIAAVCHDFEHRGVNNDFLIKARDPLAMVYNDKSPQ